MTSEGIPRFTLTSKGHHGSPNYISPRIAGECGFKEELGSEITATLVLLQEKRECSLYVQDIDHDMSLSESIMLKFESYKPEYQRSDYFREESSMEDSCETQPNRTRYVWCITNLGVSCCHHDPREGAAAHPQTPE